MDFFINNIKDNKSSLRGYDCPKSVHKAKPSAKLATGDKSIRSVAPTSEDIDRILRS